MWKIDSFKASWKEAFEILRNDMGILLLVSLRTLMSIYKAVMYSWRFTGTLVVGLALVSFTIVLAPLFILPCFCFYIVLLVAAARPSLEEKNSSYWTKFIFIDWIMFFSGLFGLLFFGVLWEKYAIPRYIAEYIAVFFRFLFLALPQLLFSGLAQADIGIFFSPLLVLMILFVFDAQRRASLKPVGRAVLMFAYNYPFFIGVYMIFRLLLFAGYFTSIQLSSYVSLGFSGWLFFFFVLYPYYIGLITNFYVKRLHEQFSLYY